MNVLPIRFEKNGFIYWQICRTDKAAIYSQKQKDGIAEFFEVWAIRTRGARTVFGKPFPESEVGPGNEDWGQYGWTYQTCGEARKRYDLLNGRGNTPEGGRMMTVQTIPGPLTVKF